MKTAIVGYSFIIPNVKNVNDLSKIIMEGKSIVNYKKDNNFSSNNKMINTNIDSSIKNFDCEFFKLSKNEIKKMDPQHRKIIESTWRMLDEFGYLGNDKLLNETGVYTAISTSDYLINNIIPNQELDYNTYINNIPSTAATKISYKFNTHRNSTNFGSACSSSANALYYAINDLNNNKIKMAIVGSSKINTNIPTSYKYVKDSIFSQSGKCNPFDENADGMVPGNGTIVIALKKLSDAISDKDKILSVIDSIAVNNDGSRKASYTSPSIDGQVEVINKAYENTLINKEDVDYIEAHGTGTKIGDAIETQSIMMAFDGKREIDVGSAKANFGHLDCASSLLSIIKSIIMFKQQEIPKQANFENKNKLMNSKINISKKIKKTWINVIGINSFGIGGTNAHIVLSNYNENQKNDEDFFETDITIPIFTKRNYQLNEYAIKVIAYIKSQESIVEKIRIIRTLLFNQKEYENKMFLKFHISNKEVEFLDFDVNDFSLDIEKQNNEFLKSFSKTRIPSENLMQSEYWIDPKNETDNHSENDSSKKIISKKDLEVFISDYIESDNIKFKTIDDLDIESFVLIDLLSNLNKKFGTHLDISYFNKNDSFIDLIYDEVNKSSNDKHKLDKYPYYINFLNEYKHTRNNLFLIHPAGGTTFGYKNFFNNLDKIKYNVITVDFPFKDYEYLRYYTIQQLANLYKDIFKKIGLNNKSIIGGYSFGGNVAYEIINIISSEKINPSLLLIDSYPPKSYFSNNLEIKKEAEKIIIKEMSKNINEKKLNDLVNGEINFLDIWSLNHRMLKGVSISNKKLSNKVLLLICKEKENQNILKSLNIKPVDKKSWQSLFSSKINYEYIDGNHYSIYSNKKLGSQVETNFRRYFYE